MVTKSFALMPEQKIGKSYLDLIRKPEEIDADKIVLNVIEKAGLIINDIDGIDDKTWSEE